MSSHQMMTFTARRKWWLTRWVDDFRFEWAWFWAHPIVTRPRFLCGVCSREAEAHLDFLHVLSRRPYLSVLRHRGCYPLDGSVVALRITGYAPLPELILGAH